MIIPHHLQYLANFVQVNTPRHSHNREHEQAGIERILDRQTFHRKEAARASNPGVCVVCKTIELQVKLESIPASVHSRQATSEIRVLRQTYPIGVYIYLFSHFGSKQISTMRTRSGCTVGSPPESCTVSTSDFPLASNRSSCSVNFSTESVLV